MGVFLFLNNVPHSPLLTKLEDCVCFSLLQIGNVMLQDGLILTSYTGNHFTPPDHVIVCDKENLSHISGLVVIRVT